MVLLDASAIIYRLEGDQTARAAVQATLAALRRPEQAPPLAVSALSRLECRGRPMRESNQGLLDLYAGFFDDPGLMVVPLDGAVLDRAAELRAAHELRTPDALQAASLLANDENGCFVIGDGDSARVAGLDVPPVAVPP